ncbi:SNF2 family DNA-dependent ATPase [Mycena maculata]|uniref:SNF2 family DNA-dependent ATPase n=1 Tax=Mycena maculata TaxID=230809 RepID=A0AAD7HF49_9AGAR|nr:SNF2 family DNA-dependent ATPase [Mycena maculata]
MENDVREPVSASNSPAIRDMKPLPLGRDLKPLRFASEDDVAETSAASSPSPFRMWSSVPASTVASSPAPEEEMPLLCGDVKKEDEEEESAPQQESDAFLPPCNDVAPQLEEEDDDDEPISAAEQTDWDVRYKRLERLLEKSEMFSSMLATQMESAKQEHAARVQEARALRAKRKEEEEARPRKRRRRGKQVPDEEDKELDLLLGEEDGEEGKEGKEGKEGTFAQPALVTGARLKDYQLEGLQWMVSLDQQGISGILADEMGLGKTLQTIAFTAYLRARKFSRPIMVVCPLSVLHNWADEYKKFAPGIPVIIYHGTPAERAELRRTRMSIPDGWPIAPRGAAPGRNKAAETPAKAGRGRGRGRPRAEQEEAGDADDEDARPKETRTLAEKALDDAHDAHFGAWPVVLTTYELVMRDRPVLAGVPWGYIVVDEGHRLKNLNCALMRELRRYKSAGRMVLTGTPLHNNLAELWALLNFVLPDVFDDVDAFQEWFSLPRLSTLLPSARMGALVATLHRVLKPFLLRRMKVDVLGTALPPKKSYVLYARLSTAQREAYEAVLAGDVRGWVARGAGAATLPAIASASAAATLASAPATPTTSASVEMPDGAGAKDDEEDAGRMRTRGNGKRKGKGRAQDEAEAEAERVRAAEAFARRGAAKHVNNMKLQNTVMQLRKVCSHPFLFARSGGDDAVWAARAPVTPELLAAREAELVGASGKMLLLDRLLGELFRRGHKVLLFSQFTTMLDIIEDWAVDMKRWAICRIDGTTPPLERRDQMNLFQSAGDAPDAPRLFLLSTRAGGLGVNLTAADTVIFYDQDWNPQMDAQAQDRAHRIGQTRPVLIFRLISAHTIEEKIMQRATEKRKLEALVIAKGKFKMPGVASEVAAPGKRATMAEMAADLLRLEGEQIDVLPPTTRAGDAAVLSDADLEALLDRSPAVFADRGTGWRSDAAGGRGAAFAVFEPPADAGGEALAGIMGEEGAETEL